MIHRVFALIAASLAWSLPAAGQTSGEITPQQKQQLVAEWDRYVVFYEMSAQCPMAMPFWRSAYDIQIEALQKDIGEAPEAFSNRRQQLVAKWSQLECGAPELKQIEDNAERFAAHIYTNTLAGLVHTDQSCPAFLQDDRMPVARQDFLKQLEAWRIAFPETQVNFNNWAANPEAGQISCNLLHPAHPSKVHLLFQAYKADFTGGSGRKQVYSLQQLDADDRVMFLSRRKGPSYDADNVSASIDNDYEPHRVRGSIGASRAPVHLMLMQLNDGRVAVRGEWGSSSNTAKTVNAVQLRLYERQDSSEPTAVFDPIGSSTLRTLNRGGGMGLANYQHFYFDDAAKSALLSAPPTAYVTVSATYVDRSDQEHSAEMGDSAIGAYRHRKPVVSFKNAVSWASAAGPIGAPLE